MATFRVYQQSEPEQYTSTYVTYQITNYPVNAIVDTGAGSSIITKHVLEHLGWDIEEPARTILVIIDRSKSTSLGEVQEVPITFRNEMITINMIVTVSETYQIILGNNWLMKAKANINLEAETMTFTSRGRRFRVPVNTTKGVCPDIVDQETEWESRRNEIEDEEPYLNIGEIFQSNKPQQETENYYTETVEDTEDTESQTTDEMEPRYMNDEEKKVFKNFMYRHGHCLACHVELQQEDCHCIEGLMIQESIQDYVFKKCQQECQQKM